MDFGVRKLVDYVGGEIPIRRSLKAHGRFLKNLHGSILKQPAGSIDKKVCLAIIKSRTILLSAEMRASRGSEHAHAITCFLGSGHLVLISCHVLIALSLGTGF